MNWSWAAPFLSYGGFKIILVAAVLISSFIKNSKKKAREEEAKLRGTPEQNAGMPTADIQTPIPTAPVTMKPVAKKNVGKSGMGSPWGNDNPFNEIKK